MGALPGIDDNLVEPFDMPHKLYCWYITIYYLKIALFFALLILCPINIHRILMKQGRWRTTPLLFFYIYAFMAIVLRNICNVFFYTVHPWVQVMLVLQPITKINLGII